MTPPTLVVFDESCDTANVLAAVYEPRGILVERQRPDVPASVQSVRPFVTLRNRQRQVTIENSLQQDAGPREPRTLSTPNRQLSAVFQYRDLIAAIDAMLSDRAAA